MDALEADCDRFNQTLPPLKSFILPGGTPVAARLHIARTVCRRAEREALTAGSSTTSTRSSRSICNRLSDLLFILARTATALARVEEPLWRLGGDR